MPTVTAPKRYSQNGESVTSFIDSVGTTPTTYTYNEPQDSGVFINNGNANLTVTINGAPHVIVPFSSYTESSQFSSFTIVATNGSQAFSATAYTSEQDIQLTGRNVKDETTLQNAATAVGNGTAIYMGGADTLKITEVSGTSTSRTVVFEVSNAENGTYSAVQGVRLSDLVMASQTSNNGEVWLIDGLAGLWFRARVSAVAGGNVTVKAKAVA